MSEAEDRAAIRLVIESWPFWRDDGRWDELRQAYAPDGVQYTTWSVQPAAQFVDAVASRPHRPGTLSRHFVGVSIIAVKGEKAIAETRMNINVRGFVHGVAVDVTNYGRTYDRFVRLAAGWKIKARIGIYEKDRMDPVEPGAKLALDPAVLARFPEGYRYLAYLQSQGGAAITPDLPTPGSAALEKLYADGKAWLAS